MGKGSNRRRKQNRPGAKPDTVKAPVADGPPLLPVIPPDSDEPTDLERQFVEEYLVDHNGVRAYLRTFGKRSYDSASTLASRLLKKVWVKQEIAAAQVDLARRCRIGADKVLRETANVAFFDPIDLFDEAGELRTMRQIPIRSRRAIASVKVKKSPRWEIEDGEKVKMPDEVVTEIKFHNKMVALDKLMNHLGLAKAISPLEALLAILDPALADAVRASIKASLPQESTASTGTDSAA